MAKRGILLAGVVLIVAAGYLAWQPLSIFFAAGRCCDRDWAKTLDTGQITPNLAVEVTLPDPLSVSEVIDLSGSMAALMGAPLYQRGASPEAFRWVADSAPYYELLLLVSDDNAEGTVNSFILRFINDDQSAFDSSDWKTYFEFVCNLVPKSFPASSISVTRHAADFTYPQTTEVIVGKLHAYGLAEKWGYSTPPDYPPVSSECATYAKLSPGEL